MAIARIAIVVAKPVRPVRASCMFRRVVSEVTQVAANEQDADATTDHGLRISRFSVKSQVRGRLCRFAFCEGR
jgi:hypothetical protein